MSSVPQWFLKACAAAVSLELGILGIVFIGRLARNRMTVGEFNGTVVKRACWDMLLLPASLCLKLFGRRGDKMSLHLMHTGQVDRYLTTVQ